MDIKEYTRKSARTCKDLGNSDLNTYHMLFGMTTEVGELVDVYKKDLVYNGAMDIVNVQEEIGDLMFYIANFCRQHNFDLGEILGNNIKKLEARYPEKFTEEKALNRNLEKERKVLEELGYD